jgi:hypothetical protein
MDAPIDAGADTGDAADGRDGDAAGRDGDAADGG